MLVHTLGLSEELTFHSRLDTDRSSYCLQSAITPFFSPFQEKLEQYLFKLRIAERKGREAKVAKMHKKIDRMRRQLSGESLGSGDEGEEVSLAPRRHGRCACINNKSAPSAFVLLRVKKSASTVSCCIRLVFIPAHAINQNNATLLVYKKVRCSAKYYVPNAYY